MTDEMQTCKLILKHLEHHFCKMEMLINHLIGSIHFHSLDSCGKADKLHSLIFDFYYYRQQHMLWERWRSSGQESRPSAQSEPHDLKNWLSQNAAGFCFATRLRRDRTGRGRRGEGRERRREGEEVASPERAGTCPVLRVCHPQLVHRAEQRRGGGVRKNKKKGIGEMKLHWLSAWERKWNANGITTPWQEITGYFGMSETNMLNTHVYTYKKTKQVRRDIWQCC